MWILSDRLLKAMGWQEYPENDDNFQPLTEDELKEFQAKTEQVWEMHACIWCLFYFQVILCLKLSASWTFIVNFLSD